MDPILLPIHESIVGLHDVVLDISGGKPGIRDNNLILGAVDRPKTYLSYADNCTLHTVCAVLLDSVARNHAFVEGNKRTGLMTIIYTYRINGYYLSFNLFMNKEYEELALDVVLKKLSIDEIAGRLQRLADKYKKAGIDKIAEQLRSSLL